ncbi:MAG: hypothetical protein PHQ05_06600 [Sterolibacterium sp.]|nr:hypothetical protein [Sterolibacterium sp.]
MIAFDFPAKSAMVDAARAGGSTGLRSEAFRKIVCRDDRTGDNCPVGTGNFCHNNMACSTSEITNARLNSALPKWPNLPI